jgi:hypothetical protein
VDHELFGIRVFVQPSGSFQKGNPALIAASDLRRRVVCHLRVELNFAWHFCFLLFQVMYDESASEEALSFSLFVEIRDQIKQFKLPIADFFELLHGTVGQLPQIGFIVFEILPHFDQRRNRFLSGTGVVDTDQAEFIFGEIHA